MYLFASLKTKLFCETSSVFELDNIKLDDGWPQSEKDVFQAALSMVVVKNSR